jgi:NAD(P)-dependent dehydrogenase (short-subunit alcohol dehydrogenase family)
MSKTILIVGFGPGVSTAVAERFGAEGFSVALVARNAEKLAAGVTALKAKGIAAAAFPADAGSPDSMRQVVSEARAALGPIGAILWNAFNAGAGDLLTASPAEVRGVLDVAVVGLLATVQDALPDLKAAGDGAVLVTNGAFADLTPQMDGFGVSANAMGLAVANAAKHKLVGLLSQRLKADNVHLGEVMIAGAVKGTPYAGDAGIEGARIAEEFWKLYKGRGEIRARVS